MNVIKAMILIPAYCLTQLLIFYEKLVSFFLPRFSTHCRKYMSSFIENDKGVIQLGGSCSFEIYTPNYICKMIKMSFFQKEPELIEWIKSRGVMGHFLILGLMLAFIQSIMHAVLNIKFSHSSHLP